MPDTAESVFAAIVIAFLAGGFVWAILCGVVLCGGLTVTIFKRWRKS